MLFSIVIPTFNSGDLVLATLDTVFAQSDRDFEVIVVDDGSTDGTFDRLASSELPIQLRRNDGKGPGAARNCGAAMARGEYLAFLDSDDLWFPWTLATYRQIISRCGGPSAIVAKSVTFTADAPCPQPPHAPPCSHAYGDYLAASESPMWHGASALVVRRSTFTAVGGFTAENINAEDSDLMLRLGVSPGFVRLEAPPTVGYRVHSGSAVSNVRKTYDGVRRLLLNERENRYPGGSIRRSERERVASRHGRAASVECLSRGMLAEAWSLYVLMLPWHVRQIRLKYLLGFPLRFLASMMVARRGGR